MFATVILLSLSLTNIVHVVDGKRIRKCHPCKDIQQLRALLDEEIAAINKKLASGGSGGSGGGGGSGSSLSEFLLSV